MTEHTKPSSRHRPADNSQQVMPIKEVVARMKAFEHKFQKLEEALHIKL